MGFTPFQMERWQSTYEHRVRFNLSESGVHPLTVGELLALADGGFDLSSVHLGYSQSNGTDELRALIASQYPGTTDSSVVVTVGGAEANFVAFWELADSRRPVAVMLPNYMQVPGLVKNFDGGFIPFHLREETEWRPDLDELASALAKGANFILITNPNNPTGVALTPAEMDEIVSLADRHGAWILADEVYRGAEVGAEPVPSFRGRYDKVLVTNTLSKAYGLPGLRLGWVVGPDEVVARLWARTDYTTIAPPSVSDALATVALSPTVQPRVLARTRGIIRRNLAITLEWIESHGGLFSCTPPDAGAICMVRYHTPDPSLELAERLRVEHSLLVVPGAHFGVEGTMRIGFGPPEEELVSGLERLASVFATAGVV
ncbi:MAG: aminotransferase class I/II-fold pyridoxal phosphate-dependent enzyme [Gemmatimonadetes bacterium]|nr:aminotransferase class I/II-fold pyridoxal phosphate-dependent enzyme [Gemmatimonadota bacterium]MYB99884.1 aminotransferase class I/II-fold pyridoxal phosphate-dependent enzyme [Gemmatimonadota bacterium]MYI45991.1 aminotransferase class I/II-fold pyridoxal phosphate-dependent enzyme [Gemmatimonadota bacterium]